MKRLALIAALIFATAAPAFTAPRPPAALATTVGFHGKPGLIPLQDKTHAVITSDGRTLWAHSRPFNYCPKPGECIQPALGSRTDLASIPRFAWSLLPPDGPWVQAALIHDYLYRTHGTGVWYYAHKDGSKTIVHGITRATPYSRDESDLILDQAMADRGVKTFPRVIIYEAVHFGGKAGWGH